MSIPVLWQFRGSHFNEKARWALDWKGIPHVRRSLLPGWHVPRVLSLTRQTKVPVLVRDGEVVADSTRIIERLESVQPDPPLYPADAAERRRALELEEYFDEEIGPHTRRMFFFEALDHPDYVVALFAEGERPATRALYRAAFPLNRAVMRFAMHIDAPRVSESRARVDAALDRIEAELRPSAYLAGDAFSVADLTAAALLTPILMPEEFSYPWPPTPEPVMRWLRSQTGRPALAWAKEMYRRHRGPSAAVAA